MGFSLQFPGVNFRVGGLSNAEQLVSPDHHLAHCKGVAVFLCSNDLMVMSPHGLAAVTNILELSLRPEAALA